MAFPNLSVDLASSTYCAFEAFRTPGDQLLAPFVILVGLFWDDHFGSGWQRACGHIRCQRGEGSVLPPVATLPAASRETWLCHARGAPILAVARSVPRA